jgi:hypothetical protein
MWCLLALSASPKPGRSPKQIISTIVDRLLQNQLCWLKIFTKCFNSFVDTSRMLP